MDQFFNEMFFLSTCFLMPTAQYMFKSLVYLCDEVNLLFNLLRLIEILLCVVFYEDRKLIKKIKIIHSMVCKI